MNIGDSLSLLAAKLFLSCRHRVSALPGQAMTERYSFAYFMRPDDGTLMKAADSPVLVDSDRHKTEKEEEIFTSEEWMRRKYAMLRRETWTKDNDWILTGA